MDISAERMMVSKEQVLAIFLMRFSLQPSKATLIVQKWLKQHPAETWETLKSLLTCNQVIISEGVLRIVPQSTTLERSTTKYRGTEYSNVPQPLPRSHEGNSRTIGKTYRGVKY
ncbi:MAG: hypothetical protein F6K47_02380 [Symploca sp. SIO2E6]|nr:hypothetical protein [Symploca sp. SIO2E6]